MKLGVIDKEGPEVVKVAPGRAHDNAIEHVPT
jgi:hypothetical protein